MVDPSPPSAPSTWRERLELLAGDRPRGTQVVGAVVAIAVALVALVWWLRRPPPPPELSLPRADQAAESAGPAAPEEPPEVFAHAAGAVVRPGVYRLPGGSRVTDLIDAAGGLVPDADPDRLNLAAEVADGQRVYIPRKGEAVAPAEDGSAGSAGVAAGSGQVNLNTATLEELDRLPGVGPATAQAILDHRERHGPFRSVDDLLDVRGIGEAKLEALRDLVSV